MKIQKELKNLENSNVELTVTVNQEDAKNKYDSLLKKYAKDIQLPGFRKGKVPVSVLERKYGESLKLETASELIDEVLKESFEDLDRYEQPLAYSQPELVGEIDFDPAKDFLFAVKYDVFPKIELKRLDGFTIEIPKVTGEDLALEDSLKEVQIRNSFVKDRGESDVAEKDNIVTINYCELDDDNSEIEGSNREDFTFTIGSGQNLYKIDDDIIGMKKGEVKVIEKTFDKDFEIADFAGEKKKIKVNLTALKYRELPDLDDELAQDINAKYKTLDDLKESLLTQIRTSVDQKITNIKKEVFFDKILSENDFILPKSMVDAELYARWSNFAKQMGIDVEKLDSLLSKGNGKLTKASFFEDNKANAEKVLKERVIVETLLTERKFEVTDAELEDEYKRLAASSAITVEEIKSQYADLQYVEYFKDSIKEKKLFDELFGNCSIKEGKNLSVKELFEK